MDQRLGEASVSGDIIVIDDPQEIREVNKQTADESQANKVFRNHMHFVCLFENVTSEFRFSRSTDCCRKCGNHKYECRTTHNFAQHHR